MNIWQYLKMRAITGESDKILLVGVACAQSIEGELETASFDGDIAGSDFNLVLASGFFDTYLPVERFKKIRACLDADGLLMLEQNVTGIEDAWLNSLMAVIDKEHIRYPRAEELISLAYEAGFELREFIKTERELEFNITGHKDIIMAHIQSFSDEITDRLQPEIDGGRLRIVVSVGHFSFN